MSDAEQRRAALLSSLEQTLHGAAAGQGADQKTAAGGEAGKPSAGERKERLAVLVPPRDGADPSDRKERRAAALARRAESGKQERPLNRKERQALRQSVARIGPASQVPARSALDNLPLLPQQRRGGSFATFASFFLCVIVPTIIASVYYIFVASNQYVSEFRFAVRELSQTSTMPSSSTTGIASLLGGSSLASNSTENFMVTEYLLSRQVVDELQERIKVRDLYSRPNIDWWARFDPSQPMEKFVSYWQSMITASYDQLTGIAVVRVRAFSPDDTHRVATTMVSLAESLVNDISRRPRLDAVKFAEREVHRAEDRLRDIRAKLSEYRNKESVIEPKSSVVTSNMTLAQSLRATLVQYQTELAALTKQKLSPDAPYVVNLKSRINAAHEQLAFVEAQIANSSGSSRPLSNVVGDYEQLDLERQFAQTILSGAVQTLEQARANATSQQLYVTPFVRPAVPQSSTYPDRFMSILMIGLACFFFWTIGLMAVRSIRDHLA